MFVLTVGSSTRLNYVDISAVFILKLNHLSVSIAVLGLLSFITRTDMRTVGVVNRNIDDLMKIIDVNQLRLLKK